MQWKIYFWILLISSIIGTLIVAKDIINFNLGDWLGMASNIILILAVYSLVFKKQILSPQVWKVILWIMVGTVVVELEPTGTLKKILSFLEPNILRATTEEMIVQIIIALPALYAVYKLGYKK